MYADYIVWYSPSSGMGKCKTNCTTQYGRSLSWGAWMYKKQGSWSNVGMTCHACGMERSQLNQTGTVHYRVWMRDTKCHSPSRNYSVLIKKKKSSRIQQQLHKSNNPLKNSSLVLCASHTHKKKFRLDLTVKNNVSKCLNKEITNPKNVCLI